jgi:hypothetical protein
MPPSEENVTPNPDQSEGFPAASEEEDDLHWMLKDLYRVKQRLSSLGTIVFALTLLNLLLAVLWPIVLPSPIRSEYSSRSSSDSPRVAVVGLNAAGTLAAVFALLFFERQRKRGDTLFQEISDELHWSEHGPAEAHERPNLRIRVLLRDYSRSTDLPLIPARMGVASYAALNVLFLIASVIVFVIGRSSLSGGIR